MRLKATRGRVWRETSRGATPPDRRRPRQDERAARRGTRTDSHHAARRCRSAPCRCRRRARRAGCDRIASCCDGHLERSLTDVVLEGRARHAKEQGQLVPALEQVLERVAEAGVGLDAFVIELSDDPLLELSLIHISEPTRLL